MNIYHHGFKTLEENTYHITFGVTNFLPLS